MKLADLQNNRRRLMKLYYTLFFLHRDIKPKSGKIRVTKQGAHSDLSTSPFDPY